MNNQANLKTLNLNKFNYNFKHPKNYSDITNLEVETKNFKKIDENTKEIFDLCEMKKNSLVSIYQEKEEVINNQKIILAEKENENLLLAKKIQELDEKFNELELDLKKGKSERNKLIDEINEMRRKNLKLFEKKVAEIGKLEPKIEKMAKELGLMINLTKCRILNMEEIIKGEEKIVQCYFINPNTNSLKYCEIDLEEIPEVRVRKYWNMMKDFFISNTSMEDDNRIQNK